MKKLCIIALTAAALSGCSGGGARMINVTDFSPPDGVTAKPAARSIEVTWKPSPNEGDADFAGYDLFYSQKSLLLAGRKNLPDAMHFDKNTHHAVIENLEAGRPYFIHVRSRKNSGEISQPSLPEIVGVPLP